MNQVSKNRAALKLINCGDDFIVYKTNIAMRGHIDSEPISTDCTEPENNDGNFRSLLRYRIRDGDAIQRASGHSKTHLNIYK